MKNLTPEPEEETTPVETTPSKPGCLRPWMVIILAILMLLLIATVSAYGGYNSGIDQRLSAQGTQVAQAIHTQYALGLKDVDNGQVDLSRQRLEWFKTQPASGKAISQEIGVELQLQFELAQQDLAAKRYAQAQMRLEWILEWIPDYPGALDLLGEVFYQAQMTPTLTPSPTLTLTPTPDNRGKEKLFSDAQQALTAGNWSVAIETSLNLRKEDPAYQAIKIDGMLYIAYRNRGVDKVMGNGKTDPAITAVDLQGGTYDLTLAAQFGPLDQDALAWNRRAGWYLTGVSYWGVDWPKALSYFEMLYQEAPYVGDGTMYAVDRYRKGLVKYGDWSILQNRWCDARDQYQKAIDVGYADPIIQPTATSIADQCSGGGNDGGGEQTPIPGGEATPTVDAGAVTPTLEAPTPTETQTP